MTETTYTTNAYDVLEDVIEAVKYIADTFTLDRLKNEESASCAAMDCLKQVTGTLRDCTRDAEDARDEVLEDVFSPLWAHGGYVLHCLSDENLEDAYKGMYTLITRATLSRSKCLEA